MKTKTKMSKEEIQDLKLTQFTEIRFAESGEMLGKLYLDTTTNKIMFDGDVHESAKVFVDEVNKILNQNKDE